MRRSIAVPSAVLGLLLAVGPGCSTTGGVRSTVARAAADRFVPIEQENQLGLQLVEQTEQKMRVHGDPELQAYIKGLGDAVVAAAAKDVPAGIQFTFKVIDDDATVNAFAMPGGHIYVYTGLLRLAANEAEVVGVLGHEVTHVVRRHVAQRLVAQYGLQTIAGLALGKDPGALGQLATGAAAQGFLLKYSRDHEREADYYGMEYAARAGWDPHGFATFFEKMERMDRSNTPQILVTHPAPGERVESANKRIAELGDVPHELGAERYHEKVLSKLGATSGS